ncbi:hypothetical protein FOCC_FOCC010833 [Frankliniella occidentalis]|nr:hypothetical protein FOCC_FOCC010833 [Frankliniella occidentalis]
MQHRQDSIVIVGIVQHPCTNSTQAHGDKSPKPRHGFRKTGTRKEGLLSDCSSLRKRLDKYGFDTPPDYNDHELYCGGFSRQWQRNKGRCGVCGDPWDTPQPRLHEAGGKYGTGTLECLDRHVLQRADRPDRGVEGEGGEGEPHASRYYPGPGNKVFASKYRLPPQFTCKHCVLQWRYIAGNNWGMCANGTGAVGCGPQEEFRACADVVIVNSAGEADDTPLAPEDVDVDTPVDGTPAPKSHDSGSGLFVLLIALCALAGSATVFSLMYLYFYHAGDRVKGWLAARRRNTKGAVGAAVLPPGPPAPPPRHKRPSSMGATIVC